MPTLRITKITALEILDSRGNPTLEVTVTLANGISGTAAVPSGASTGTHEALELRDNDKKRYSGKGVRKAVHNVVSVIAPKLRGLDAQKQRELDHLMIALDGTPNKSRLGANAILGVSLALAHAAANGRNQPLYQYFRSVFDLPYKTFHLPTPTMNIINGGAHADWALDIQEFMVIPQQKSMAEKIRCGAEVFATLGELLRSRGYLVLKGDEGGYAPKLSGNQAALDVIMQAVKRAGYRAGHDVALGMDIAASEFYNAKQRQYAMRADKKVLSAAQMIALITKWTRRYPIVSVEDGLAEDDWENWIALTKKLGRKIRLVGDDLFVTNVDRLSRGISAKIANTILIKPNQIGSLTETIEAIELAHAHGYQTSISHRSGETIDTTIADLAVAVNSEFIKSGSLARSERTAKYNRLLAIEAELHGSK